MSDQAGRKPGVFISYRRGETNGQARAIHEMLEQRLGEERVFMDVDAIALGEIFKTKITEGLLSSGVALVLIGKDWLNDENRARLQQPNDWVRIEIETAIQRHVPIIPILVERAPMPTREQLPEPIQSLVDYQSMDLENSRWDGDMIRLNASIDTWIARREQMQTVPVVGEGQQPSPPPPPEPLPTVHKREKSKQSSTRLRAIIAAGIALVVLVVILAVVLPSKKPTNSPSGTGMTAGAAVSSMAADRLFYDLVTNNFGSGQLPADVSAQTPSLSVYHTVGLTAPVVIPMSDPAYSFIDVDYLVYANPSNASYSYTQNDDFPQNFSPRNVFTVSGIADPIKCRRSYDSSTNVWGSSCSILSSSVLTFVNIQDIKNQPSTDEQFTSKMVESAIKHLLAIANGPHKSAPPVPPGPLHATSLFDQLSAGGTGMTPYDLSDSNPTLYTDTLASPPPGAIEGKYIYISFPSDSFGDSREFLEFYTFDGHNDAASWYGQNGPYPTGTTRNAPFDSTGFVQKSNCATYKGSSSTNGSGFSWCSVLDGNVVIVGEVSTDTSGSYGNSSVAQTLAEDGILDVYLAEGA